MKKYAIFFLIFLGVMGCKSTRKNLQFYDDIPFPQDYSIKYYFSNAGIIPVKVVADRNGHIQILTSQGLMHPVNGKMLYPGSIA